MAGQRGRGLLHIAARLYDIDRIISRTLAYAIVTAITGYRLLTRDVRRYRPYFPTIDIIAPPRAGLG